MLDADKVAIVTGGNRGIGFLTAQKLAARGLRVILTARSASSGADAVAAIRRRVANARVEALPLDLSSQASVREFAAQFRALELPLHVLLNSAGMMLLDPQLQRSADGFELTFATNHLGPFLLTTLLLPDLRRSTPSRVVTVSSQTILGRGGGPKPRLEFDNLNAEKQYDPSVLYRTTKLMNMLFAMELDRRERPNGVTSNAVCPGFVPSTIAENQRRATSRFMFRHVLPRMPFARSVAQASANYVFAALDPSLDGVGGKFIVDRRFIDASAESYDEAKASRLWEISAKMVGLDA